MNYSNILQCKIVQTLKHLKIINILSLNILNGVDRIFFWGFEKFEIDRHFQLHFYGKFIFMN